MGVEVVRWGNDDLVSNFFIFLIFFTGIKVQKVGLRGPCGQMMKLK